MKINIFLSSLKKNLKMYAELKIASKVEMCKKNPVVKINKTAITFNINL